jgi:hypothetical protein
MNTRTQLPHDLVSYLKECGIYEREMATSSMNTRTYHDLGWYGDVAEGCLELLMEKYGVDMTGFHFDTYYPPEFEGQSAASSLLCSLLPFVGTWLRKRRPYRPLTLEMVHRLIHVKKWEIVAVEHSNDVACATSRRCF